MHVSWQERLDQHPELRAFDRWPVVPAESLPRAQRKRYLRNRQIVAQALAGVALRELSRRDGLSVGRISQLLQRCLGGDEALPPALTQGLIPYRNLTAKTRARALPTLRHPQGNACAFRALLGQVPGLREGLDAMILAKLKDAPEAQRLTPRAVHGQFKRILAEAHWPADRYPYTTESLAYQSVRRYLQQRMSDLQRQRQQRRPPRPRDAGVPKRQYRAQRATQIDEHILDLQGRVHLQLNDELIPLRLARANVLVATDVDTTCVLGYHLAPTRSANQQDLLTLFDHCLQPWQPLALATPGLSYAPGACFPSGLGDAFPISFGYVEVDNAFAHRAQSVIDFLCQQCGATLRLGPPAMPTIRQLVESVFDYIGKTCTHRVASTTGSYPTDPARESRQNRKRPPLITFQTLNEALSVILTEYNVTRRAALGHASPLELFQHHCANHFVRFVPPVLAAQWQPLRDSTVVTLHWNRRENRTPHVNFYYVRYQGPELLRVAGKEAQIRVQYFRPDIRTLHASTLAGEDLGTLHAATPWQRFAHSLATRQWIHKNTSRYRLNARDPLASYFQWLLEHRAEPAMALSLLRVYTEFTADQASPLALGEPTHAPAAPVATLPARRHPSWHLASANHRG